MAVFSKQAAVNIEAVKGFHENVSSFAQLVGQIGGEVADSLEEMATDIELRAQELEQTACAYDQLYAMIRELKENTERHISALESALRDTPKETEKKSENENGEAVVEKEPNPEYQALEMQIRNEKSRLSSIDALSWKVYNEVSYSHRVADEQASFSAELKNSIPELRSNTGDAVTKAELALHALERNIRAINDYISFRFRLL